MTLAEGEYIVKRWNYAKAKEKKMIEGRKFELSLTVTNKRIISTVNSNRGLSQDEVYVEDVASISTRTGLPAILVPALLLILGVALMVCGYIFTAHNNFTVAIPMLLVGAIFIVISALLFSRTGFELTIVSKGSITPSILTGASNLRKSRKSKAIRVRVDRDVAFQIQDELGAVILNVKNSDNIAQTNDNNSEVTE